MAPETRYDLLAHVIEIANSSVDISERLDNILSAVSNYFKARNSSLFMQKQGEGNLVLAHSWPRPPEGEERVVDMDQGVVGPCAMRRASKLVPALEISGDKALEDICEEGDLAAIWPVMDDHRLYAVLVMALPGITSLPETERHLLDMVARELAGTIRNFNLYFEAKKRIAELNVLSDLGRAAISTIEVEELMNTVAGICAKLLNARGGLVHVFHGRSLTTRHQALYGNVPEFCIKGDFCRQLCLPAPGETNAQPAQMCKKHGGEVQADQGLCVHLSFKGGHEGHLCVFDKVAIGAGMGETGFTPEDRNLLTTMASMVSSALENALTFHQVEELAERNEEMVGALGTLFEISTILMTTVDFDETVLIILYALTHPAGLDHDRAILFLVDEEQGILQAVAERSKNALWGPTRELTHTLLDLKNQLPMHGSLISPELEGLEIELKPESSVLARTAVEKRPIQVDAPGGDAAVDPVFLKVFGPAPFVTVPMFAKGKVVGVLVVNNALSKRPFSEQDRKYLAMLANLGGLSVENSRLYQNLEKANRELAHMRNRLLEADKLAALGEIAAGVAHEIRNPLVSIGGFTRRIRKKVGEDSDIRPYLDVIIEEVTRLENTLNEMLDFSTDSGSHYDEHSLNRIMGEALELLRRDLDEAAIKVDRLFADGLPPVFCDDRQIKHVFFNLILNAIQAMGPGGGTISLRTFTVVREGKQFVAGEVTDTGGGIAMDVIHNIFNPFFTTKDSGSGMGLSIVHKIVSRHFGQVEVHSGQENGASFLVTLPAAEEGRAYLK